MRARFFNTAIAGFVLSSLGGAFNCNAAAALEPLVYTVKFPSPQTHLAEVSASIPTEKQDEIELMMPIWTPGYYRVENYADQVRNLSARTADGFTLEVTRSRTNRWRIKTGGQATINVSYQLACEQRSVTRNWVGTNLVVLNGGATFLTLAGSPRRPYEVRLELPADWDRAMSGLDAATDGLPNHFHAADYDTLVDSPIVAGNLSVHEFSVDGSRHYLVDAGDVSEQWDGANAAAELEKMVQAQRRFWGFLPFNRYVFLNVFRPGGGGLEHLNSTLLTASSRSTNASRSWVAFVCHEYFHAFNVKRLRPAEIDSFDYEQPPRTGGLWVSEGLTTYYGELLPGRAGLSSPEDFLSWLSSQIERLQTQPGRRVQTLEQASLEVWSTPASGLARNAGTNTVSYYVKGPIVGFLLDARIQHATAGRASLDDVMRLAYRRYSGAHGFTAEQFRQAAEEIAHADLRDWFERAIRSTEELDYSEALDWFGLRFADGDGSGGKWKLEIRPDATEAQRARWRKLSEPPAADR